MDGSRFDAWTRRGFGLAAGGLAGSLLAQAAPLATEAKKKKKKKKNKCREFGDSCSSNGKDACCCGLACQPVNSSGKFCCRSGGSECSAPSECCSGNCVGGYCICKTNGAACTANSQCCSFKCGMNGTGNCQAA